jgi:hypothetical protein
MRTPEAAASNHPAPHRHRVAAAESVFGLLGGPGAWFIQLCAGSVLSNWPCFPEDQHRLAPVQGYEWTWAALGLISLAAVAIAVAAFLVSRTLYRRTRDESGGDHQHLMETGAGRTRFLALWGMVAGAGFAVAAAFTGIAFFILPRCAG